MTNLAHNITNDTVYTMSSREIAELTGKRHDNVMRDARAMLVELYGEEGVLSFEDTHENPQNGQSYPVFQLPKRESLILVSGYNLAMRARIIDRWQELEAQASQPLRIDVRNPLQLALIATQLIEVNQEQAKQIESMKEDVSAHERITKADGSFSITEAAKALQIRPKDLFDYLARHGWIYKRPGSANWLGYQSKTNSGLLEHKVTTVLRPDGTEKATEQVRVTALGLGRLAKLVTSAAKLV